MLKKIAQLFNRKQQAEANHESQPQKTAKPRKPRQIKQPEPYKQISEKERATLAGEPWVSILSMNIDSEDPSIGNFQLDFNDKFVINLIRAGYKMKETDTDDVIVDRWFTSICRNIALEIYEQEQADPSNRGEQDNRGFRRRNIGDGRAEIS